MEQYSTVFLLIQFFLFYMEKNVTDEWNKNRKFVFIAAFLSFLFPVIIRDCSNTYSYLLL